MFVERRAAALVALDDGYGAWAGGLAEVGGEGGGVVACDFEGVEIFEGGEGGEEGEVDCGLLVLRIAWR